jgi:myosin heavy subunit
VAYFDNRLICEMVDNPKTGIIAVLDEQCNRPNGTDKVF